VPTIIALDELRFSPTAFLYQGGEDIQASIFVMAYGHGQGPDMHAHPYPEVFVIQEGQADFIVGDERITVGAGHVVLVPAERPHGFKGSGTETLRAVSVHPSPTVVQTDL
jgi:mannose-6-phosphate isomerase-like protein (cupin superfamily)